MHVASCTHVLYGVLYTHMHMHGLQHMHTSHSIQVAITLMLIFVVADIVPNGIVVTNVLVPIHLVVVVIIEITHLCIRIRRRRNIKCFLTWVGVT